MYKELKRAPLSPGCQAPPRPPCPPRVRRVSRASCGSCGSCARAPRCLPAAPDRAPATPRRTCSFDLAQQSSVLLPCWIRC